MALLDTIKAVRVRWHTAAIAGLAMVVGVVQEVGLYQVRELLNLFISDAHLVGVLMIVLPLLLAFTPSLLHTPAPPAALLDATPPKNVDQGP